VVSAIIMVAQPAFAQTAVTNIQMQRRDGGIELILETATNKQPEAFRTTYGETLVIDLINTQLQGEGFVEENPAPSIASIEVIQQYTNTVRVKLVGTEEVPTAQINLTDQGFALNITTEMTAAEQPPVSEPPEEAPTEDPIELVVSPTREQYRVEDATTGTRTDTPLRDIPQSIQVVPKEVIEDQQATELREIVRNVSGIVQDNTFGGTLDRFNIRGFEQSDFLRDGFRDTLAIRRETANVERVEVLKGPASILHGRLEPGGVINLVTEKPTEEPFFALEPSVGSFGLLEPSIDVSGPLNDSKTIGYRLNALYREENGFRDNFDRDFERTFISPVLSWDISNRTELTLELSYTDDERPFDRGLVAEAPPGEGIVDIPFDRNLQESDDFNEYTSLRVSSNFEHEFSDNLKLRNRFLFLSRDQFNIENQPFGDVSDDGQLSRFVFSNDTSDRNFALQTNLVGNFKTGSIEHEVLFGVDLDRQTEDRQGRSTDSSFDVTTINVFDPVYDDGTPSREELNFTAVNVDNQTDSLGIYLQDQIAFSEKWKLLIGGRLDFVSQENENRLNDTTATQDDEAFSPRVGLVYQPIEPLSLYTSFSRSFVPNGDDGQGGILDPERGTQYEVGVKSELLDGRLSATLAAFNITKSNISVGVEGPPAGLQRAIGEQRSRGIELDIAGEITNGWKIIASYAYTDTEVTDDNGSEQEGNELSGVPRNAASLWSVYEIQKGNLRGLGIGAGVFFVGDREGNLDNDFELPSYARVDARLSYQRDNWQAALNFKNLFNIDYVESRGFGRVAIEPGIPFTVIGSFSVEF